MSPTTALRAVLFFSSVQDPSEVQGRSCGPRALTPESPAPTSLLLVCPGLGIWEDCLESDSSFCFLTTQSASLVSASFVDHVLSRPLPLPWHVASPVPPQVPTGPLG